MWKWAKQHLRLFCDSSSSLSLSSDEEDEDDDEEEEDDEDDDDAEEQDEEDEELDPDLEREQEDEEEDEDEDDLEEQVDLSESESESELDSDPLLLGLCFLEAVLGVRGSVLAATIRLSLSVFTTGFWSVAWDGVPLFGLKGSVFTPVRISSVDMDSSPEECGSSLWFSFLTFVSSSVFPLISSSLAWGARGDADNTIWYWCKSGVGVIGSATLLWL